MRLLEIQKWTLAGLSRVRLTEFGHQKVLHVMAKIPLDSECFLMRNALLRFCRVWRSNLSSFDPFAEC